MKKGFLTADSPCNSKLRIPQNRLPKTAEGKYTFDHFDLERFIGRGNFSEVFEVSEKGTDNVFALKIFNRQDVVRLKKVADVRMERHAMLRLNDPGHPNVIHMVDTFKDQFRVCILYEFAECGEVWETVRHIGVLDHVVAQNMIAQLVEAVDYIHSKNIVHRDLKAENLVLSKSGVVKVIDFGTAMDIDHPEVDIPSLGSIRPQVMNRTSSTNRPPDRTSHGPVRFEHYVGTPQFMPPEAIKNRNSGKARDLWSLGCTIYQLLIGLPPFQASTDYFVLLKVMARDLEYPPDFPVVARDLIDKLLAFDPNERLGAREGMSEVKAHPYFTGLEFGPSMALPTAVASLQHICIHNLMQQVHRKILDLEDEKVKVRTGKESAGHGAVKNCDERRKVGDRSERCADVQGPPRDTPLSESLNDVIGQNSGDGKQPELIDEISGKWLRIVDDIVPLKLRHSSVAHDSRSMQYLISRLEFILGAYRRQSQREDRLTHTWMQNNNSNRPSDDASEDESSDDSTTDKDG